MDSATFYLKRVFNVRIKYCHGKDQKEIFNSPQKFSFFLKYFF